MAQHLRASAVCTANSRSTIARNSKLVPEMWAYICIYIYRHALLCWVMLIYVDYVCLAWGTVTITP